MKKTEIKNHKCNILKYLRGWDITRFLGEI